MIYCTSRILVFVKLKSSPSPLKNILYRLYVIISIYFLSKLFFVRVYEPSTQNNCVEREHSITIYIYAYNVL